MDLKDAVLLGPVAFVVCLVCNVGFKHVRG